MSGQIKTFENKASGAVFANWTGPSIFARMMNIQCELMEAMGLPPMDDWESTHPVPAWVKNTCIRYRQTIFKAVLKLKPGRRVNWRNYGRCIGLMERCKAFYAHDLPMILKREGLHRLTKRQQSVLDELSGEQEMRQYYLKKAKRPADDPISTEELAEIFSRQQIEQLNKHREIALYHIAKQDTKTQAIFWKGIEEGYSILLNPEGEFSGDDRRADVHGALLAFQYEVEKMRRTLPAKTRNDLRNEMVKLSLFQDNGQAWFNEVCKDVKLSMKGRGAPHKLTRAKVSKRKVGSII